MPCRVRGTERLLFLELDPDVHVSAEAIEFEKDFAPELPFAESTPGLTPQISALYLERVNWSTMRCAFLSFRLALETIIGMLILVSTPARVVRSLTSATDLENLGDVIGALIAPAIMALIGLALVFDALRLRKYLHNAK